MTWMWLPIIVVLIGAKLNAEIEHQTACVATISPPKPLGSAAPKLAGTVGQPQA
jgi:membrane protein